MDHGQMDMPMAPSQTPMPMPMPASHRSAAPAVVPPAMQQLLAQLVADPVVMQKIQRDSVLRNRWQDPDVRRLVVGRP